MASGMDGSNQTTVKSDMPSIRIETLTVDTKGK